MSQEKVTGVTYKSGTHPTQSWDVMQVILHTEDAAGTKRIGQSFVIARDANESILRRTDVLLDQWEIITDEDDLRYFRSHFDRRDKSRVEESAKAATQSST
jgi:hypothetical protein